VELNGLNYDLFNPFLPTFHSLAKSISEEKMRKCVEFLSGNRVGVEQRL